MSIKERNFSATDLSETDLRDSKLDQLFLWYFRGMFKNLKDIELLNCHVEKHQIAMILTIPINGNAHQVFLNQQNALGLHAKKEGEKLYIHKCAKIVVRVIENYFGFKEILVRVSSENSSEGIRYMDHISKVFYRYFAITNCNPLYPNALELQNVPWITYGQQLGLVDKPDKDAQSHK